MADVYGREQQPRVRAFLDELIQVCKKHEFSLAHEDTQGAFVVKPYEEDLVEWLLEAADKTEKP